ncbi:hypothetical protein B7R21_09160 [Subtercola boreus]|uniref:Uncharacterized protein n=1 Tax=Subtercola boreus TaxID=120213 RepID=A0A3E0VUG3_9MICO|nr:hypothetical protein [Subtercola boreus]RFA13003.1 hypothetical protein B7R21_09160 [Subtercola boreus]
MTSVIKHSLRAVAGSFGSYHPAGWHPKLSLTLLGPSSPGRELVWTVARPDGSPWFEHRVPAPVLDDREHTTVELERWQEGGDLDEAGTVEFTLRLVSVFDGADELLHDGRLTVLALPGEHRYAVDNARAPGLGLVALDTADEPDAPRLGVRMFVAGDVEVWRLEAHCLLDGVRLGTGSVETADTATANDGQIMGQTIAITFDGVRGWNNLSASGWGGDWHLLDQHDGRYRVMLVSGSAGSRSAVAGEIGFEVRNGRIVAPGRVEPDVGFGVAIVVGEGASAGDGAGDSAGECYGDAAVECYGDAVTASATASIDDAYACRVEPGRRAAGVGAEGASAEGASAQGAMVLDDETEARLGAFVDRAERLLQTWEVELAAPPPYDFGQMLAAEAVGRERAGCDELAAAVSGVDDSHRVLLAGETIELGDLRKRIAALFPAAEARISSSTEAEADELAPFRALLAGGKLAVFDDHPADSFVYTTTDRHIIETPEELAAAEYWFFEGPLDVPSSARVEGIEITGSIQGWRVLGWHFDTSGAVLDEFETQGLGPGAPKSAFRPPA